MPDAHDEMSELQEHAEQGHHAGLAMVSLSMAILAVLVAIVTLLGHRSHTEEIILHTRSSDQWAYYQAHNIRGFSYEAFLDQLQLIHIRDAAAEVRMREKYEKALEHEKTRIKEIADQAREYEAEAAFQQRRADRFDLAEGLLEAALVITSITLLTRRRYFWYAGGVIAVVGLITVATAFFVHH
jgi:hypothetical protein